MLGKIFTQSQFPVVIMDVKKARNKAWITTKENYPTTGTWQN